MISDWIPPFLKVPGAKVDGESVKTPADAFRLFFTLELMNSILWSNAEAKRRDPSFDGFTLDELNRVFGIQIVMCINRVSDEKGHWSTNRFRGTPGIKEVMTRDR